MVGLGLDTAPTLHGPLVPLCCCWVLGGNWWLILSMLDGVGFAVGGGFGQIARVPGACAGAEPNPSICVKRVMGGT
jgi:hypothetical protein